MWNDDPMYWLLTADLHEWHDAPEAINLGTGKRSCCFPEFPLAGRQFYEAKGAFDAHLSLVFEHWDGCHAAGRQHSVWHNLVGVTVSCRPTSDNEYPNSLAETGHLDFLPPAARCFLSSYIWLHFNFLEIFQ